MGLYDIIRWPLLISPHAFDGWGNRDDRQARRARARGKVQR